eukprot:366322-Chlamydomonas_euryale.AAC.3
MSLWAGGDWVAWSIGHASHGGIGLERLCAQFLRQLVGWGGYLVAQDCTQWRALCDSSLPALIPSVMLRSTRACPSWVRSLYF